MFSGYFTFYHGAVTVTGILSFIFVMVLLATYSGIAIQVKVCLCTMYTYVDLCVSKLIRKLVASSLVVVVYVIVGYHNVYITSLLIADCDFAFVCLHIMKSFR